MPDAAYFRAYRADHRERLSAQTRERRRLHPRDRGDRHAEYARAYARQDHPSCVEIPASYTGHDFDRAARIVGPARFFEREVWEDEMGTVVVALLEHRGDRGATRALVALRSSRVTGRINEYSLEASQEWTERH